MNADKLAREGRGVVGKVKETAGDGTGDTALQGEGLVDQPSGKAQKIAGAARDAFVNEGEPLADKARRFMRERPTPRRLWQASSISRFSKHCAASAKQNLGRRMTRLFPQRESGISFSRSKPTSGNERVSKRATK